MLRKVYDHGYPTRARTHPQNGHKPSSDEEDVDGEEEEVETTGFPQVNERSTRRG